MEVVAAIVVLMIILFIKGIFDVKKERESIIRQIKEEWGNIPSEEYTESKFEAIRSYYDTILDPSLDIDDITWADLNMDEIYMIINNTGSSFGEEYLYALLRKPQFDESVLNERKELINYFTTHKENREKLQEMLLRLGKLKQISLHNYLERTNDVEIKKPWLHYLYAFGFLGSMLLMIVNMPLGIVLTLSFLANNVIAYTRTKAKIEIYFNVLSYVLSVVDGVDELSKSKLDGLEPYMSRLQAAAKEFSTFKKGAGIVLGGRSATGGLADILIDYLRMIFHIDIMKFNNMIHELRKHMDAILDIYEVVGLLDSMIAVASFRQLANVYCEPELSHRKEPFLDIKNVYHPMIHNPVKNSIYQKNNVLLTGSNASGKSTFLRTIGINQILAQTIYTTLSNSYRASYFKIYSSMALKDDIFSNESYYIVEIKSLKRILDQLSDEYPVLCFIDEVLRGTNTLERISASAEILNSFSKHKVLCMAATHDIELTHILEKSYTNYHFQEEVVDNDVLFDYKLYKGRAMSKNAIKLLSIMGYDKAIIQAATKRANAFLETGEWLTI